MQEHFNLALTIAMGTSFHNLVNNKLGQLQINFKPIYDIRYIPLAINNYPI